eukprot:9098842-Pyramimonas_sp.AAC.1
MPGPFGGVVSDPGDANNSVSPKRDRKLLRARPPELSSGTRVSKTAPSYSARARHSKRQIERNLRRGDVVEDGASICRSGGAAR